MKTTNFCYILYNLNMKNKHFIIAQFLIYVTFITLDLLHIDSTYIKYLGIILCFGYALLSKKKYRTIAMAFTLIADFFLLVLNKYYEIGLISFIIVQFIYYYFLGNYDKGYFNMFLLIRGFIIICGSIILYTYKSLTLINELVLIYFSNLVLNAIQAYLTSNKILAIGLTLFVCCDICVGLHNINAAYTLATFLMWVFYLPSQILIVIA